MLHNRAINFMKYFVAAFRNWSFWIVWVNSVESARGIGYFKIATFSHLNGIHFLLITFFLKIHLFVFRSFGVKSSNGQVQPISDKDSTAESKRLWPQCELYQRMQMHPFHRKCCHDYKLPTYAAPRQSLCRNLTFIFPKEGCDFTSMPKLSSQVALRSFKW